MGAAQHDRVDPVLQQRSQVAGCRLPQFRHLQVPRLDQGHKVGTTHLPHLGGGTAGVDGAAVGPAGGGGRGGQDADPVAIDGGGHTIDQAQHRHARLCHRHIEGEGVGGVAGHQQHINALLPQPVHHLGGNRTDLLGRSLAVGHPRRVAQVEARGVGVEGLHLPQHGEAAQAAIEQSNEETQEACCR